jgi:hypothetical protein
MSTTTISATLLANRGYVVSDSLARPFGASDVFDLAFDFSTVRVVLDVDEITVKIHVLTAHSEVERYSVTLTAAPLSVLDATLDSIESDCEDN